MQDGEDITKTAPPEQGRSLVWRLVRSAAMWVVPALLFTALSLILFYRASAYKNFNDPLESTIQALVANIETSPGGTGIMLADEPIDPRYQLALSGRYWLIGELQDNDTLSPALSSLSLYGATLSLPPRDAEKIRQQSGDVIRTFSVGPDREPLSLVAQMAIYNDQHLVIVVAADRRPAAQAIGRFSLIALGLLTVLALGLTIAIYMQVRLGLSPLFALRDRVVDVREGRARAVEGRYPKEIKPLADELNSLIGHNRDVVEYARNHVSNLAHGLKTPLAVLVNETEGKKTKFADLVARQTKIMSKQVDHHLHRARAAARGQAIGVKTPVDTTLNSLVRTLGRIYRDKDLDFQVEIQDGLMFRGEKRDLEEMAGNLLDNACKWTKAKIHIRAEIASDHKIRITIDDDGPGMAPDQYENVLKRGTRLDETTPGTGFGPSIATDLAKAYKGSLKLERSPLGGLRTILFVPKVMAYNMYIRFIFVLFAVLALLSCQKSSENTADVAARVEKQVSPALVEVEPVEVEINAGDLKGSYLNAGKDTPIILIVPGSGPTDRDGNSRLGIQANTYKFLAEQLYGNNISSVRVDKRGMFGSAAAGDANAVTVDIYADDYRFWIEIIKQKTGENCVYLLGHSEGGLMVSAAAIGRDDVCGLILVSALGRSFGDTLRAQLKANPANAPVLAQAFAAIAKLEAGENVDTTKLHPGLVGLFYPDVQDYLISVMSVDPAKLAGEAKQRTLIIQGKNDIQVHVKDAELIYAETGGTLVLLDEVNHVLKIAPADRAGNIATYSQADIPVAEGVIKAVTEFVNQ